MKGTIVPPAVSPEEAPTPAANLDLRQEPYDGNRPPLEAPTSTVTLDLRQEPYDSPLD